MPTPVRRAVNTAAPIVEVTATKTRSGEVILDRLKTKDVPDAVVTETIQNPAHVEVDLHITKNMNNYESLRVGVKISSPCHNTDESKLATGEYNLGLAMKILEQEAAAVSSEWFT